MIHRLLFCILLLLLSLAATAGQVTPVTVVQAESRDLARWEPSVGQLHAIESPLIAAEVAGRVLAISADVGDSVKKGAALALIDPQDYRLAKAATQAEVERFTALIRAQQLQVKRLRSLMADKSASRSALDEAEAKLGALKAQLAGARVRLQQAERDLARTRVTSPIDARVDQRQVSVGDWVNKGTPLFRLTTWKRLRARLPFPESLLSRLRPGLPVRLTTPLSPGETAEGRIDEIRPAINEANRAVEVIVDFDNPGNWRPGASVTGEVQLENRPNAVVVPEAAVVRRPAGTVVYLPENGHVRQRKVVTGLRIDGLVEIRHGLKAGETVVLHGAGFLTDGAAIEVKPR
ncbi:efflux RND transporter periplasmic adaptor subunit [Alcanivorax sp.]|uniref:efflux RND transporter periplasmic adaptor subunit n=1 Tax=Alcanivorax sp. TaxID=1872427 RepID=UPI0025844904|nr:efflux RND transporter periplasmic adaptor subunit [Alcanivorax sp.]